MYEMPMQRAFFRRLAAGMILGEMSSQLVLLYTIASVQSGMQNLLVYLGIRSSWGFSFCGISSGLCYLLGCEWVIGS